MPTVMPFDPDYYDPLPPQLYGPSPSGSGALNQVPSYQYYSPGYGSTPTPWNRQSFLSPNSRRAMLVQNKANPDTPSQYMEGNKPDEEGEQPNRLDLTAWRYRNDPEHIPNFLANLRPFKLVQ